MQIIDRRTKLKARRALRLQRRQAEAVVADADQKVDRLFLKRFDRLVNVRRFVVVWTVFVLLLGFGAFWQARGMDSFYLAVTPTSGGTYREGILGFFTTSNPLFATSQVDVSVSSLIYPGLFKQAPDGKLVGDLASKMTVDDTGRKYTVSLRDNVLWHDGEAFDADDVVFTYASIQNPNVRSAIRNDWLGVKVTKTGQHEVVFELPSVLSSFKYSLTNGIIPQHILSEVDKQDFRSSTFNTTQAIGTGPFKMRVLEVVGGTNEQRQERIVLAKNTDYYGGQIALDSIVIRAYRSEEVMLSDFDSQIIQAMVGLNSLPESLLEQENVRLISRPLMSSVMVFFNTSTPILAEKLVRQALVHGTNTNEIRRALGFELVQTDSPFLKSQFAYDPEVTQLPYDFERAQLLLDEAGWLLNDDGIREKEGKPLSLNFISQSLSDYASITQQIQKEWKELGVRVDAVLQPEEDIQSGAIASHDYDVLLYGIAIGFDPDVFAYWHSSQADINSSNRLNLSEFKNDIADEALEAGRTRIDQELRKVKYDPFLEVWRDEAPAIGLYQPRFLIVVRGTLDGFHEGQFTKPINRYYSVTDWKIRNSQVVKE